MMGIIGKEVDEAFESTSEEKLERMVTLVSFGLWNDPEMTNILNRSRLGQLQINDLIETILALTMYENEKAQQVPA